MHYFWKMIDLDISYALMIARDPKGLSDLSEATA
jgi:hypothetical protein